MNLLVRIGQERSDRDIYRWSTSFSGVARRVFDGPVLLRSKMTFPVPFICLKYLSDKPQEAFRLNKNQHHSPESAFGPNREILDKIRLENEM